LALRSLCWSASFPELPKDNKNQAVHLVLVPGYKNMCPNLKRVMFWLCLVGSLISIPIALHAHAVLVDSTPKPGSKIHGSELSLWLKFNVRVDGSRSSCVLVVPGGSKRSLSLDPQHNPDILTSKITGLAKGDQKLEWQVLAADGHISRGEVAFEVE